MGRPYDAGEAVEDEHVAQGLREAMWQRYPQAFRSSARCIFTRPQGQFAFSGHLLLGKDGQMRLLALTDLGNTIWAVSRKGSGEAAVLTNHSDWSDAVLIDCALRDVVTMYASQPPAAATVVRHGDGCIGLCWWTGKDGPEEFQFDPETRHLRRYVKVRHGQIIYEVVFSGYVADSRWEGSAPHDIAVSDARGRYRLNVHVLKMDPIADSGHVPAGG